LQWNHTFLLLVLIENIKYLTSSVYCAIFSLLLTNILIITRLIFQSLSTFISWEIYFIWHCRRPRAFPQSRAKLDETRSRSLISFSKEGRSLCAVSVQLVRWAVASTAASLTDFPRVILLTVGNSLVESRGLAKSVLNRRIFYLCIITSRRKLLGRFLPAASSRARRQKEDDRSTGRMSDNVIRFAGILPAVPVGTVTRGKPRCKRQKITLPLITVADGARAMRTRPYN